MFSGSAKAFFDCELGYFRVAYEPLTPFRGQRFDTIALTFNEVRLYALSSRARASARGGVRRDCNPGASVETNGPAPGPAHATLPDQD